MPHVEVRIYIYMLYFDMAEGETIILHMTRQVYNRLVLTSANTIRCQGTTHHPHPHP